MRLYKIVHVFYINYMKNKVNIMYTATIIVLYIISEEMIFKLMKINNKLLYKMKGNHHVECISQFSQYRKVPTPMYIV
jgi:hypothetical protein